MANYTVINGSEADYTNVNAGGTDVGALSFRETVALSGAELVTLLDGTTFPRACVTADWAVPGTLTPDQIRRAVSDISMWTENVLP